MRLRTLLAVYLLNEKSRFITEDYLITYKFQFSYVRGFLASQITYVGHAVLETSLDGTTRYRYEQNSFADGKAKEIHRPEEVAGVY